MKMKINELINENENINDNYKKLCPESAIA